MTDEQRAALLALAKRCEAATGPDRDLDGLIAKALGWSPVPNPTHAGGLAGAWYDGDGKFQRWGVPLFTASIDAALTLVPEGRILRSLVASRFVPHTAEVAVDYAHGGWIGHSDHSAALAISAAALRAWAAQ